MHNYLCVGRSGTGRRSGNDDEGTTTKHDPGEFLDEALTASFTAAGASSLMIFISPWIPIVSGGFESRAKSR